MTTSQTGRQIGYIDRWICRYSQIDRQANRQTDRQTDR